MGWDFDVVPHVPKQGPGLERIIPKQLRVAKLLKFEHTYAVNNSFLYKVLTQNPQNAESIGLVLAD